MKSFLLAALIAFSLGLNVLVLVGLTSPATLAPLAGLVRPGSAAAPATPTATSVTRTPSGSGSSAGTMPAKLTGAKWADLKSDDPATLVANLRAAGFSAAEIRAILAMQLQQKVSDRRRELAGPAKDTPYWRGTLGSTQSALYSNPQGLAELRKMNQENARLLDSLLGPSPNDFPDPYERLQYADLPADKVGQLKLITADYGDITSSIQNNAAGAYFPEDRAMLKLLNDERDKDIRALLTPEEYDNYQLRSSNTAQTMRDSLQLFQPTEEEFRRIFALQYAFNQQYNTSLGGLDADLIRQRSLAQAELTAEIKATLSPARLAEYEKATDSIYRQAVALVTRLDLPKDNATQLWSLQKDTQQRMTALRTDRNLSVEARNQTLSVLQQEVTSRATAVLGGVRGYDAYRQNGGQWIQNIVPPALPPAPAR